MSKLKKALVGIIVSYFPLFAFSQTAIDYDYKDKKVILPALKKELTKDDRYAIFMPSRLRYFTSQDEILNNIWNPFLNIIEIKAKVHQVKYDYRFDLVSSGIQKITPQVPIWYKTEMLDLNNIPREVKGWVRDYTCTFPCALVISDGQGKMIDSILISGDADIHTVTIHGDFLQSTNRGFSLKPTIPLGSVEEITRLEAGNESLINKKLEEIVAFRVFSKMSLTLCYLFKNYNTGRQIYGYGFVKAKGQPAFPEIDKIVTDYKIGLDSLSEGKFEYCAKICSDNKTVMESLLSGTDARVDKNVKEILYYNLSHANLLTGDFAAAWKYYKLFIQSGVSEQARMASELRGRIFLYEYYDKIKRQVKS